MDEKMKEEIAALSEQGHRSGLTIVEVIKLVREKFQLSLGDAKDLVSSQPCWASIVKAAEPLQEEAMKIAIESSKQLKGPGCSQ